MSVRLTDIINKHLEREIPVYTIKAENVTGSATLPSGKHLRVLNSNLDSLTITGGASVLVLQNTTVNNLIVNNDTIVHIKGGQLQEATFNRCKLILEDVQTIEKLTLQNNVVGLLSGSTIVNEFYCNDAIFDIGGWQIEEWKECNNSIVRFCGLGKTVKNMVAEITASELYLSDLTFEEFGGFVSNSIIKFYDVMIEELTSDFTDSIVYFKGGEITECEDSIIIGSEITSNGTIFKKGIGQELKEGAKLFLLNSTELTIDQGLLVSDNSFIEFNNGKLTSSGSLIQEITDSSILLKGSELHLTEGIVEEATDSVLYVGDFEQCDCGGGTSFKTITRCRLNLDSIENLTGNTIVETATESMIRFLLIENIELEDSLVKEMTDCDLVIHRCGQIKVDTIVNSATKSYIEANIVENIEGSTFFGSSDYTEIDMKDVTAKGDIILSNTVLNMIFCDVEGDKIELTDNMTMTVLNSKLSGSTIQLEKSRLIGTNSRFDHTSADINKSTIDFETAEAINLTSLKAEKSAVNHSGGTLSVSGSTELTSSYLRSTSMKLNGSLTVDDSSLIAPGSSINVGTGSMSKSTVQCANMQISTFDGNRVFLVGTVQANNVSAVMVTGQELQGNTGTVTHSLFNKTVFEGSASVYYSIIPYHAGGNGQISRSIFGTFNATGGQMQECCSGHVDMTSGTIINAIVSGAGDITSTVILKSIMAQNSGTMSGSPLLKSIIAAPQISGGGAVSESLIVAPTMGSGNLSKSLAVAAGSMSGVSSTLSVVTALTGSISGGGSSVSLCGVPMIPSTPGIINIIGNNIASQDTLNHFANAAIINFALVIPANDCLCCLL